MKDSSFGHMKPARRHRDGSMTNDWKGRPDRRSQSMEEEWDVGGPRWRIGWGGLSRERETGHSERRD
ncbi:MAG: hypothetical protein AB7F09_10760 [Parvibaculaceae bacterium]